MINLSWVFSLKFILRLSIIIFGGFGSLTAGTDWYQSEPPVVFAVGGNLVERFGTCPPTIITAYSLLLHVDTNFDEVSWSDVVDVMHPAQYIAGGLLVVVGSFFRAEVIPLVGVG